MKKMTKAILDAQFLLKEDDELKLALDILASASEKLDIKITPELEEAIERITDLNKKVNN